MLDGFHTLSGQVRVNHNLLFTLLFLVSVLKILPGEMGNRWVGGMLFLTVSALLVMRIKTVKAGFRRMHIDRPGIGLLGIMAVVLTVLSCVLNFVSALESGGTRALVLMISALAAYAFLFLCLALFLAVRSRTLLILPLLLVALVCGLAVLEIFFPSVAKPLQAHTLRSALLNARFTSSVFTVTTDFGPWAAVLAVFFWIRFFLESDRPGSRPWPWLCMAGLTSVAVLVAGSRTGFLGLMVGLASIAAWARNKSTLFRVLLIFGVLAMGLVLVAGSNKHVRRKVIQTIPAVKKIKRHETIHVRDFIPNNWNRAMSSRLSYWQEAYGLWRSSPWFGIGLGQFNMQSSFSWKKNVNNLYLNILVECGVFVFALCMMLLGAVFRQVRGDPLIVVLSSLAVMAFFDNLYDHVLPWNLTVAWVVVSMWPSAPAIAGDDIPPSTEI